MKNIIKSHRTRFALHDSREKGQILLILVMVIAIAITIVLTITFTTKTDTQVTKLEEDSQKALAAAEAGIESSLKNNASIQNLTTLGTLSTNISTGSTTLTTTAANTFTSPKIVSSEAYTAYLGTYSTGSSGVSYTASTANPVTICFGDSSSQPSLDIAVVKSTSVMRYLADPATPGAARFQSGSNKMTVTTSPLAPCTAFAYSVTIPGNEISTDSRLLVIRALYASTKLLISQSGLPAQGKTVTSQATTTTGVTKKVQLFQSYPQIPAEFFYTMF